MDIIVMLNDLPTWSYILLAVIGVGIVISLVKKVVKLAIIIGVIIFVLVSTGLISKVPPLQEKIDSYIEQVQTINK